MKLQLKYYLLSVMAALPFVFFIKWLASIFGASTSLSGSLGVASGVGIGMWVIGRYKRTQGQILDQEEFLASSSKGEAINNTPHLS